MDQSDVGVPPVQPEPEYEAREPGRQRALRVQKPGASGQHTTAVFVRVRPLLKGRDDAGRHGCLRARASDATSASRHVVTTGSRQQRLQLMSDCADCADCQQQQQQQQQPIGLLGSHDGSGVVTAWLAVAADNNFG